MILLTNLENVRVNGKDFNPIPVLKLTTGSKFALESISEGQKEILQDLQKEAKINGFRVSLNNKYLC